MDTVTLATPLVTLEFQPAYGRWAGFPIEDPDDPDDGSLSVVRHWYHVPRVGDTVALDELGESPTAGERGLTVQWVTWLTDGKSVVLGLA